MTAVEWLIEQCPRIQTITSAEVIEQAKKMEKEQALQFLADQSQELNIGYEGEVPPLPMTFPTIECIGDNVWEELTGGQEVSVNRADWSFGFGIGYNKAISNLYDLSQNAFLIDNELLEEISDEEILKEANRIHGVASIGFEEGAKWYREQIKKK